MTSSLTFPTRSRTAAWLFAASVLLGACSDPAAVVSPGSSDASARLAFAASISSSRAAVADLRVQSSYLRQNGSTIDISSQTITLGDAASQQVPVSIELAPCLADASRAGPGGAAPAADECLVQVAVELVLDGLTVDRQLVGPLSLRPGQQSVVSQPVALFDIADVRIVLPPANVVGVNQPLRLEITRSLVLGSQVFDGAQRPVTGRTPTWTSSNPAVATVSATGSVAAVTTGTTRITAELGGRLAVVDVRVVPLPAQLTVVSSGFSGQGTVRSQPAGIDCVVSGSQVSGACTFTFPGDAQVTLSTTLASGSEFVAWSGACPVSSSTACTLSMAQPRTAGIALRALRSLTITGLGTGLGLVTATAGGISCTIVAGVSSGLCTAQFVEGATVTLAANASGSSAFRGWTGDCAGAIGSSCEIIMNSAKIATARFEAPVPVFITGTGAGSGFVVSSPSGISCTLVPGGGIGACSSIFADGTVLTLSASAGSQNAFRGWGGDCAASTGPTCTITATGGPRTVSVRFDPPATLTVAPSGTGDGTVVSGGVISCARSNNVNSGRCSVTVTNGSMLTLDAVADPLSTFTGWTGACSGTGSCQVTLDQARLVGAVFTRRTVSLTLQLQGPGGGTVRLASGESCVIASGASARLCVIAVPIGRPVLLEAAPDIVGQFSGFSGACTSTGLTCSFTANSEITVTARFGPPNFIVSVAPDAQSVGAGAVYSDTEAIDCLMSGTTINPQFNECSQSVAQGATITLTATANQGSAFIGWGGACSSFGSSPVCTLTPGANAAVTANFGLVSTVTLTVSITTGVGAVTVTGSFGTVTCSRDVSFNFQNPNSPRECVYIVPPGSSINATALGSFGNVLQSNRFSTISGAVCSGITNPCTDIVVTNNTIFAAFVN